VATGLVGGWVGGSLVAIAATVAVSTHQVSALPGAMTPGWGQNGVVELPDLGGILGLAPQPDGSVVVVGSSADPKGGVVALRLHENGDRDPTYGGTGRTVVSSSPASLFAGSRPGLDGFGRTLVALSGDQSRRVARLLPDGRLDPTYGTNDTAALDLATTTAMVVSSGGDVVVAGGNHMVRLTASGAPTWASARAEPCRRREPSAS
jgi:hypothetical protein